MTMTMPQINELTAIASGKEVGRVATKDKAAQRFIRLATENGIPTPEAILEMDFEAAKEALTKEVYSSPSRKAAVELAAEAAPAPAPKKTPKPKGEAKPRAATTRIADDAKITEVKENPKRAGTKAHAIFSLYKAGQTAEAFIKACVEAGFSAADAKANLSWDRRKGFITVHP